MKSTILGYFNASQFVLRPNDPLLCAYGSFRSDTHVVIRGICHVVMATRRSRLLSFFGGLSRVYYVDCHRIALRALYYLIVIR